MSSTTPMDDDFTLASSRGPVLVTDEGGTDDDFTPFLEAQGWSAEGFGAPSAGVVLHRVLATSARMFLLNDADEAPVEQPLTAAPPTKATLAMTVRGRPSWAQSAVPSQRRLQRRETRVERVHQTRVAMRRIRSNLRTFRLLLHPAWGTDLRAELSWYGGVLGGSRDLHLLTSYLEEADATLLSESERNQLLDLVAAQLVVVESAALDEESELRRRELTATMTELWEGPPFKDKAAKAADVVLPELVQRAWTDLRGAAHTAKRDTTDENLHKVRIRLKDLRYGCETVSLVAGGPARKTARAAEALQSKLGDLHDATASIMWLESVAANHPELVEPVTRLIVQQEQVEAEARSGWKKELRVVEKRWRAWQS